MCHTSVPDSFCRFLGHLMTFLKEYFRSDSNCLGPIWGQKFASKHGLQWFSSTSFYYFDILIINFNSSNGHFWTTFSSFLMFNCPHKYSFTYSLSEKSRNWVNITSSPRKENESYFRWSRLSPSWALHLWVWEHQEWVFAGPKDWQRPDVDRLEPERKEFPPTKQYWLGFQRPPPDWPLINRGVSLRGLRGVIHRRLRREFASNVPSQVFEFAVDWKIPYFMYFGAITV